MKKELVFITGAVIIFLSIISLISFIFNNYNDTPYFKHNEVELSIADYNAINENFPNSPYVDICNMDNYKCITIWKLPNG